MKLAPQPRHPACVLPLRAASDDNGKKLSVHGYIDVPMLGLLQA
ncbi:hypothetical protein RSPO_m00544 (plasmid) [Ralstonia solanacearum Po82]|uniref:Uncharacterized protein n=1 Tax=Ralstonia solanacearum (strain Po82) TaxID=1031711 RepID=F6G7Q4_RALS8|nr:hypothetical protein [Ralstonia solanacearum]AEG71183.1 hypothetical protein RSPO_m00544 [Ralstonia solanacearum Po82]